jgi:hypothetical protein
MIDPHDVDLIMPVPPPAEALQGEEKIRILPERSAFSLMMSSATLS